MDKHKATKNIRFIKTDIETLNEYFSHISHKDVLINVVIELRRIVANSPNLPLELRQQQISMFLLFRTYHERVFDYGAAVGVKEAVKYIRHTHKWNYLRLKNRIAIRFNKLRGKEESMEQLRDSLSPIKMILFYYNEMFNLVTQNEKYFTDELKQRALIFDLFFRAHYHVLEINNNFGLISSIGLIISNKNKLTKLDQNLDFEEEK